MTRCTLSTNDYKAGIIPIFNIFELTNVQISIKYMYYEYIKKWPYKTKWAGLTVLWGFSLFKINKLKERSKYKITIHVLNRFDLIFGV